MIESGSNIFVEDKKRDYLIKTFSVIQNSLN
jgi:hypothetical protein